MNVSGRPSRQFAFVVFASCIALSLSGCWKGIQGNGIIETDNREVGDFRKIDTGVVADVVVHVGQPKSVRITFDQNLLPMVKTEVNGETLKIFSKGSWSSKSGCTIEIGVPELTDLDASGVGSTTVVDFAGDQLAIDVSGVGSVTVSGTTKSLDLNVSGVGNADLDELKAESVTVSISGVGGASVFASQSVSGGVSGVGGLEIHGNPTDRKVRRSGIGDVSFR
jgi:Putative auto-transporter adhesin, head GIN domain